MFEIDDFEIEPLGVKELDVYDIEVDSNHNFFANDVLVHNSLFLSIETFLGYYLKDLNDWKKLIDDEKISYILKISKIIENYVNKRTYEEVQKEVYNSIVNDFKISFKQEIIAKSVLLVKKKKYAYWCVNQEGAPVDELSVTGLEIIRSDSSESFRERLKEIMNMILKDHDYEEIRSKIKQFKKELKDVYPEEVAASSSINNIDKYIIDGEPIKGTPWHVKGVANYRKLLKSLNLENEYEDIAEGIKARVVYLKKNRYGIDIITFLRWPKEFNNVVEIDYNKMIEKFFINKIESFLDPMGRTDLLYDSEKDKFNLFFD